MKESNYRTITVRVSGHPFREFADPQFIEKIDENEIRSLEDVWAFFEYYPVDFGTILKHCSIAIDEKCFKVENSVNAFLSSFQNTPLFENPALWHQYQLILVNFYSILPTVFKAVFVNWGIGIVESKALLWKGNGKEDTIKVLNSLCNSADNQLEKSNQISHFFSLRSQELNRLWTELKMYLMDCSEDKKEIRDNKDLEAEECYETYRNKALAIRKEFESKFGRQNGFNEFVKDFLSKDDEISHLIGRTQLITFDLFKKGFDIKSNK